MKPFQNKAPDRTYTQSVKSLGLTQVSFHSSDIRPQEMAASDPLTYAEAMLEAADEHLNGDEWRENMNNAFPSEVRPFGSVPTCPQVALMADRSVTFDPRQTYDGRSVSKGEAVAGSLVSMEAPEVGVMVSARLSILDHTVQFGFTARSMEQTADKVLNDLELTLAGKIAESLEGQPSVSKVYAGPLSGTPAAQAEDFLDLIAVHLDTFWGRDISEFGVLVPVSLRPCSTVRHSGLAWRTLMTSWAPVFRSTAAQTVASSWCPKHSPCCPSVRTAKETYGASTSPAIAQS